jgi:hypothetical protein
MASEHDHEKTLSSIQDSMSKGARPAFDDDAIEHLRILIRIAMEFYCYLEAIPPWPYYPDNPAHNTRYKLDSVMVHMGSFSRVMNLYCVLVGWTGSTVRWDRLDAGSLKEQFLSVYASFIAAVDFETKCRLLLDLMKLQIVFVGVLYDCVP